MRPENPQSSTHYPPAGYLCEASGHITSREIRTLRTELPEYELRAYPQKRNDWSDVVCDYTIWRAYGSASAGFNDNLRTFVVKCIHGWLPIGLRERRCSATADLCPSVPLAGPDTVAPSV
jgi:hypothetical protein